jgi:CheY-like chemotaxis protein
MVARAGVFTMSTELTGRPGSQTILVVDDDCEQRAAFDELLTLAGYQVVVACDGQDALELLRGGLRPTVIVLDLAMPRMSGWVFLEHLRGPEQSSVPVLVTSGDTPSRAPSGADACLHKPVDAGVFRSEIGRLSSAASGRVSRG